MLADYTAAVHSPTTNLKKCGASGASRDESSLYSSGGPLIIDIYGGCSRLRRLRASFIHLLARASLVVFFWVFHRAQG
jgi:hypothetical protein